MIGRTISHYRIVSQLGAGGMGIVYHAEDLRLGRQVALKFLSEDLATDRQAVDRLRREARAASALNHPNICTIYDIDEGDGQPFIAMELMKGQSLRDRLLGGSLKIHQVVDFGIQIADALDAAHSSGIIHRDIKPANIFITDRGQVKVLDFGLAKLTPHHSRAGTTTQPELTQEGLTLGTIAYMSPEQVSGEDLDGRSDLFSLGDVLYECLTGRQPFTGKTSTAVLAAILNRPPVSPVVFNPELPQRLQDVVSNCLEKDRELRYQSAADLRADLRRVRRDIDSGHSTALRMAAPPEEAAAAAAPTPRSGRPAVIRSEEPAHADGSPLMSRVLLAAAALGAIAVITALIYQLRVVTPPVSPDTPPATTAAAGGGERLLSRLALARTSLDAKNYSAALAYANEALVLDPNNSAAQEVRETARATLARFDETVADVRARAGAGDLTGAARSLEAAQAINPTAPVIAQLSAELGEKLKQADQARQKENAAVAARQTPPAEGRRPPASGVNPPEPARPDPPREQLPPPPAAQTQVPAPQPPRVDSPPSAQAAPPQVPPASSLPAGASPPADTAAAPAKPVAPPEPPAAPSVAAAERRDTEKPPAGPTAAEDEAAIRRIVATYARAIETKDLGLFRSIKPNLSGEEERRLQAGFKSVQSQQVNATVLNIDRKGAEAVVVLRRRDIIQAGGRQQTAESQQTLNLSRAAGTWVIVNIR